jgi:hypothetical protein
VTSPSLMNTLRWWLAWVLTCWMLNNSGARAGYLLVTWIATASFSLKQATRVKY